MQPELSASPSLSRCAKELAASQTRLLDAQMAGASEAQQRELEFLRRRQEFEGQIRCLEEEKGKLGSRQEAQRHLAEPGIMWNLREKCIALHGIVIADWNLCCR